ncbi:MAG: hypothetical protein ABJN26_01510 [Stappiaceae bacterium]
MKHTIYAFAIASLMSAPVAMASDDVSGCYLNGGLFSEGFSIGGFICNDSKWVKDSDSANAEICLHHNLVYGQGAVISIGSPIEDRNDNEKLLYQVCGAGGQWSEIAEKN